MLEWVTIVNFVRLLGGLLAYGVLSVLFYGIWRGTQRQAGRTSGNTTGWLRSKWFYLVTTLIFFGVSAWGWQPLPLLLSAPARIALLVSGALLYFPGVCLVLWGRLALGSHYFVSTGTGAQLFEGQPLITHGPYALVRHPMYLGLVLASTGSLLLYQTWTTLLFAAFSPFLLLRARREEQALAGEFGESWHEYCNRVPLLLPRLRRKSS